MWLTNLLIIYSLADRWPNGAVFDGTANMGKKEGKGVATRPDGTVYNGHYSNGKEDGFGSLIRPDGVKYRGEFRNGMKEGHGIMLWHNRTYDGEWSKNQPHGQGCVTWSNGTVYTGQFEEGSYNGMGVYVWPSGKKFVGRWEKGIKNGHGVHTWPSGQSYDGNYTDGARDGYGHMTWPDGSMYCGGFKNNRRSGRGIQTDSSGAVVHCGLWKQDRPWDEPEDHDLMSVERPPRLRSETNYRCLLPRPTGVANENIEKDGMNMDFNDRDESLTLLSLAEPVIESPREGELQATGNKMQRSYDKLWSDKHSWDSKLDRDDVLHKVSSTVITTTFDDSMSI